MWPPTSPPHAGCMSISLNFSTATITDLLGRLAGQHLVEPPNRLRSSSEIRLAVARVERLERIRRQAA